MLAVFNVSWTNNTLTQIASEVYVSRYFAEANKLPRLAGRHMQTLWCLNIGGARQTHKDLSSRIDGWIQK